jgi:pyrrolidone-carboxylate peptidase
VSYANVSSTIPTLLEAHDPDYIFHMGMAAGRDCYTIETRAHRDNYRIKDVDDSDGFAAGEQRWKNEGVPEVIYVDWDEGDVLRRWDDGVKRALATMGFLGRGEMDKANDQPQQPPAQIRGHGPMNLLWGTNNAPASSSKAEEHRRKAVVKLSADAGRFLCEYIIFESLSRRWLDARNTHDNNGDNPQSTASDNTAAPPSSASSAPNPTTQPQSSSRAELVHERLGKVAFLHVPGWTGVEDINRGVMVAEEAIRALVGSWEDGYRRNGRVEAKAYTAQHSEEVGRAAAGI